MTPSCPATLLLPGALADPAWLGADALRAAAAAPGAAALARRAQPEAAWAAPGPLPPDPGHQHWLHRRFGLVDGESVEAAAAYADGAGDAHWRLDPVHLQLGHDRLALADPRTLALEADEAAELAAAVTEVFGAQGLALHASRPARWYLRELDATRALALRTRPLVGAIGRSIDAWQPHGPDARRWLRLVNEVQMTWHGHAVNRARAQRGLPEVNGLWLTGRVPARHAGADRAPDAPSHGAHGALGALAARGHGADPAQVRAGQGDLVLDDRLLAAQIEGDPARWRVAWAALDAECLQPMARGEPPWAAGATIVLAGDAGWRTVQVTAHPGWRFWRRVDPLRWFDPLPRADAA
jgi:hypothetical protein